MELFKEIASTPKNVFLNTCVFLYDEEKEEKKLSSFPVSVIAALTRKDEKQLFMR